MKQKTRFRNQYNYDSKKDTGFEQVPGQSMTVPDESYSIQELIKKHQSGLPVNVDLNGEYDDEPEHEDFDKRELMNLDLAEKAQIIEEQQNFQQEVKNKVEENKKAKEAENDKNEKRTERETETETLKTPSIQEEEKQ